jgi:ribonuclease BN (tRNA processing enzyme)
MMSGEERVPLNHHRILYYIFCVFIPFLFFWSCVPSDPGNAGTELIPKSEDTQVVILGTGTPNIDPQRFGACIAVIVNGQPYLVDFGPGAVQQASAAYEAGVKALAMHNLTIAFLTHMHSDHTAGFADLMLTPWILGREQPLRVYGPSGIIAMSNHILSAYHRGIRMRIEGSEKANPHGYRILAEEIEPGLVYQDNNVKVKAFLVKHGAFKYAFGYRFETPSRTIVISGDTIPTEALITNAMGCDILIHEVYSMGWLQSHSPEGQKYHASAHTSSLELAEIANRTRPALLVLYHQLMLPEETDQDLLDEVRRQYKGKVAYGKELDVF